MPGRCAARGIWGLTDLAHGRIRVDPWTDYAITASEGACLGITFRHVPFDANELARIIGAGGRPYAEEAIYLREQ